ncbi:hypothetical protein MBLNU457_3495t1 [Dothideomycetes sp. NU457]
MTVLTAFELKEKGNRCFKNGEFDAAEENYSLAIQKQSDNPIFYTNRAFVRLRLQKWQGAVDDCQQSIELTGKAPNYKANFYMARAQLELNHPHEALASALAAYGQVMYPETDRERAAASSIPAILTLVIACRKRKFEARQLEYRKSKADLLAEMEQHLQKNRQDTLRKIEEDLHAGAMLPVQAGEERAEIEATTEHKINELRSTFAVADPVNHPKKEIPEWAIDTITFELMHDPVVTRSGHSYERHTIVEHLKVSPVDPITREPLTIDELRPNIALRKALDDFWENAEGWAMDW